MKRTLFDAEVAGSRAHETSDDRGFIDGNDLVWALTGVHPTDTPCEPRCEDEYCGGCAMAECPHREPLHRHHDGCPACEEESRS